MKPRWNILVVFPNGYPCQVGGVFGVLGVRQFIRRMTLGRNWTLVFVPVEADT